MINMSNIRINQLSVARRNKVAKRTKNQETVSRLSRRSDFLLSTFVSCIKAMDERLNLISEFSSKP